MKRISSIALTLTMLCAGVSMADNIGENFEPGGVALGGYLRYSLSLDTIERHLVVHPTVDFLVARGVTLGLYGDFRVDFGIYDDVAIGSDISYTFGYDPEATSGMAYAFGLSGEVASYQISLFRPDDVEVITVAPSFSIDWFANPRLSIEALVRGPELAFYEGVHIWSFVEFALGTRLHVPNRDLVVGSRRRGAGE